MNRSNATQFCRDLLNTHGLHDWGIRLNTQVTNVYGLCSHDDKCIILNAHHIDTHPDEEVFDTIKHEVAHALVGPGHKHDGYWCDKARELGAKPVPCKAISLSPTIIDAIRSGATIEVTHEKISEEVLVPTIVETFKPKYQVTRLQDKCPFCKKVAVEVSAKTVEVKDETKPDLRFIQLECGHTLVKSIPKATPFGSLVSNWHEQKVRECKHEWGYQLDEITTIKNQCKHCQEFKLHPFQVEGARFLESGLAVNSGGAIFDEMGLGKTVQALAYLWSIRDNVEAWPVVIVVKSSIKFQWFKEALRWLGPRFVAQILEKGTDIPIPNFKIYIASYDLFVPKVRTSSKGKLIKQGFDVAKLIAMNPKCVLIDECQQIKNPDAGRTQELRKLVKGHKVIALSGTPWKNRGGEYYTVFNMLSPMKFPSHARFIDQWVNIYYDGKYTRQGGIRNVEMFREYVKDIALRREIKDVMTEMPAVNKTKLFTSLDQFQQDEINEETEAFVKWWQDITIGGEEGGESMNILAKLARMRHLIGLAKIPITEAYVDDFLEESGKTKVAVLFHHVAVGEIFERNFKKKYEKDGYVVINFGKLGAAEKFEAQEKFNNNDKVIGLLNIMGSGEGLNLPTCDTAVMHEREWNPANEEQAAPGRFRRITSHFKIVNVIYNLAAGTVDEILDGINSRKEIYFHNTMNSGELPTWNQGAFTQELANSIVKNWNKMRTRAPQQLQEANA